MKKSSSLDLVVVVIIVGISLTRFVQTCPMMPKEVIAFNEIDIDGVQGEMVDIESCESEDDYSESEESEEEELNFDIQVMVSVESDISTEIPNGTTTEMDKPSNQPLTEALANSTDGNSKGLIPPPHNFGFRSSDQQDKNTSKKAAGVFICLLYVAFYTAISIGIAAILVVVMALISYISDLCSGKVGISARHTRSSAWTSNIIEFFKNIKSTKGYVDEIVAYTKMDVEAGGFV